MTAEEFEALWIESGKRQRELMAMATLDPDRDDSVLESPMFQRWQDGSDIVDRDDDADSEETIPDDMPLEEVKILAVCGSMRHGLTKSEALAKYGLSESYFDENVERVSNTGIS